MRRLARSVLVAAAATAVAATVITVVVLRIRNTGLEPEGRNWWIVSELLLGFGYAFVGSVLVVRERSKVLAGLFLLVGGSQLLQAVTTEYAAYVALRTSTESTAHSISTWAWIPGLGVLVTVVPFILPAGALQSRSLRPVVAAATVLVVASTVADPARWGLVLVATAGLAVSLTRWLTQRTDGDDRLQAWLTIGVTTAWLGIAPVLAPGVSDHVPGHGVLFPLLQVATIPLLAVGVLLGAARHIAGPVDVALHRFLEAVLLGAGIVLVYTVLVAGLGEVMGATGPTWLLVAATGLIAVIIEPARRRITVFVDRVVYGLRDDPLALVRQVMRQVTSTVDADGLLPALADTVAAAMCLDYVAIDVLVDGGWVRNAEHGRPTGQGETINLSHHDELVGRLVVGWTPGSSLRRRDREALDDLATNLSVAVSWVQLAAELRRSNAAVVSTREEERRRLRRDLHDGLGPALTGISLGVHSAIRQLEKGSTADERASADSLLRRLAAEIDNSVIDVKRIVRDLRPTALDDQSLSAALTEFARRFHGVLQIHLDLPNDGIGLPAAVEVASYRIATEALTNVVRHAAAANCWVHIAAGKTIEIDIDDDGVGLGPDHHTGVGLVAMRERAIELGGVFSVTSAEPHGTRVHAAFPAAMP